MKETYLWKLSIKHLWNHKGSSFIIFMSIAVCVFSLLLLTEEMFYSTDFLKDVDYKKRSYSIGYGYGFSYDTDTTLFYEADNSLIYDLAEELLNGNTFPVESIDIICAIPECATDAFMDYMYIYNSNRTNMEMSDIQLTDGRLFTEEEERTGANVIILDTGDSSTGLVGKKVGGTVTINEVTYEIIGTCEHSGTYITYANAVKTQMYRLYCGTVTFSHQLNQEEKRAFEDRLSLCGANAATRYDEEIDSYVQGVIRFFLIILVFLFFITRIIVQMFLYMVDSRKGEFTIYQELGCSVGNFRKIFYYPALMLALLGESLGMIFYALSRDLKSWINMDTPLCLPVQLVLDLLIIIIVVAVISPVYRKAGKNLCGK